MPTLKEYTVKIAGLRSNVVGLPVEEVVAVLAELRLR